VTGTSTTITPNCTNAPTLYSWIGNCTGSTGLPPGLCTASKGRRSSSGFSVAGSNASGLGPTAQITINWH
jgi:hypothetical protein